MICNDLNNYQLISKLRWPGHNRLSKICDYLRVNDLVTKSLLTSHLDLKIWDFSNMEIYDKYFRTIKSYLNV